MPEGSCSVEGCAKPAHGRGWCKGHYKRWVRHRDPLHGGPLIAHQKIDPNATTKRCSRCREYLPLAAFDKCNHKSAVLGRMAYCRKCKRLWDREKREKRPEWARDQWKKRYAKQKVAIIAKQAARAREHPEHRLAHKAVARAVKLGMKVPDTCEECGREGRLQAHHHDYARQLDVRWLCARCHGRLHAESSAA